MCRKKKKGGPHAGLELGEKSKTMDNDRDAAPSRA